MKNAKRVVLFGIDGAGTFFEQAETPNMDRIFAGGAVSRRTLTEIPTISAECWGGMLHGVECGWHGLTNSIVGATAYPPDSVYPSVFRVIREAMPEAKLASFCDWNSINVGIIEDGLGVHKYHASAKDLVEPAIRYIQENDFTLLFFQFDNVDGAGHRYGYGTPEHLAAIAENDEYIGRIVAAIEERGWLEDTLLLVEADHGGTPNYGFGGHHGGATDAEKYVSFFAAGGDVRCTELKDMLVRDTPAIILHALDIPQPASWTGRVPAGLFPDCLEARPRPVGCPPQSQTQEPEPMEEKGGFPAAFADLEPLLYLPFESDEEFPQGAQVHGKLYRQDGRIGSGVGFADGSLEMNGPSLADGYSILFWVRPDHSLTHETGIAVAVGFSCRQVNPEPGLSIEIAEKFVRVAVNGTLRDMACPLDMTYPGDLAGKWNHVAFTVDRTAQRFGIRVNFGTPYYWGIPEGMSLPEDGRLYIGQDADGGKEKRLSAVLDDLCICRKPVNDDEMERLKGYYQA